MPIVPFERFVCASFDYLILGGGTAGLALASRLSEDDNLTIGVIEAGGVPADIPEINVPAFIGRTIADPTYDWTFLSVPQVHAKGRTVLQPRGKGLGGSSIINFMGLFRPSKIEYDALEGLGNKGWNWENLLGYMKKGENTFPGGLSSEDAKKYAANPKSAYHGVDGPLQKSLPLSVPPQLGLLFDSAEELGVPRNGEMGDGTNIGSMSCFTSIDPRSAKRSSAFSAYFLPIESRPNLLVLTSAQVTKVAFLVVVEGAAALTRTLTTDSFEIDPTGVHRAVGAQFIYEEHQASIAGVKKDVIASAGALQTPHLLELSGVGDQSILRKYGIEPLIHLPGVGENLQEHPCVATIVEIDSKYQTMDEIADPGKMEMHQELYAPFGLSTILAMQQAAKGLFASIPAAGFIFLSAKHLDTVGDAVSFRRSPELAEPSLQRGLNKQYKLQKEWLTGEEVAQAEILYFNGHQSQPPPLPIPGKRYASFVHVVMHPLSRGSVHLTSSDPLVPPAIDPNYLADPADLEFLSKAVNFSTRLVSTGPFGEIVKGRVVPEQDILGDSKKLKEWIKESVRSTFHPIGTAAMLPQEDGGVVDSELRVYGTANLRVVDVSVLPMAADILKNGGKV